MKTSDKIFALLCGVIVVVFAAQRIERHLEKKAWEKDRMERIAIDFRRSREEVKDYISRYIPEVTDAQIDEWTASGKLEAMEIDGQTRYFRNAGPNLFRIDHECEAIKAASDVAEGSISLSGNALDGHDADDAAVIPLIVSKVKSNLLAGPSAAGTAGTAAGASSDGAAVGTSGSAAGSDASSAADTSASATTASPAGAVAPSTSASAAAPAAGSSDASPFARTAPTPYMAEPRHYHVRYTLTVDADAVPAGETVRCWLPYPRKDVPRQGDVHFIAASEPKYVFSEESCAHSTLYMEKKAVAGQPTVFSEEFEYTIYGEWHPLYPESVKEYNVSDPEYKHYTSEREAHIKFTPRIKAVADSLSKGLDNPYLIARTFFTWVNDNFPWASAREYSTVENIPMYVLESGHGDCGMVTLLFMTLCRYKGIPTRWQSGFMMHPSGWNLHDWAEVYFEGPGWVPVDESFGIPSYAVRRSSLMGTWAPAMSLPAASGAGGAAVSGASGIGAAVSGASVAASVAAGASVAGGAAGVSGIGAAGASGTGASGSAAVAAASAAVTAAVAGGVAGSTAPTSAASLVTPGGDPVLSAILALPETEYFYLGGIDPYRMVVNTDYGQYLSPRKKYPRSETVDFQRGEVEWKGGNLYFNKWSYSLEIL